MLEKRRWEKWYWCTDRGVWVGFGFSLVSRLLCAWLKMHDVSCWIPFVRYWLDWLMHAVMFVFAKFYFQGRLVTNSSTSIGDNDPSRFLHVYKRLQTKTHSCSKKCDCFVILLLQLILSYSLHANLKRLCLKLAKIQNGESQREIHPYATTFVF